MVDGGCTMGRCWGRMVEVDECVEEDGYAIVICLARDGRI